MFSHKEQEQLEDKKLRFLWCNIIDCLEMDKQAQSVGKTPKGLNRQIPHFTFYKNFYEAMELMEDKQSGQYVKAIYGYMFDGKEPKLNAPVDLYYKLAKRKLELSKIRSNVGKKGGIAERKPITAKQVYAQDKTGIYTIGMDGFLKNNPQIKNDIFKSSLHLTKNIEWNFLNDVLPDSNYRDCKSLYQILSHYDDIIAEL